MYNQPAQTVRSLALQVALFVFFVIFGCGALFFAYQIFDTVRYAVITLGVPDIGDLPAFVSRQVAPQPNAPDIAAGERVNILFLGIDRRPNDKADKGPWRTDTMMIATLDPKTLAAGVVTIPRDLYVEIPGVGENRINTANLYGDLYKYPGGGPALAKKTVEYNLGRQIHYYVLVDFAGFRKAIDAIGGIDINVPKAIDDPEYPTENYGVMHLHFNAGMQHMNGEQALQYARTRHGDNDFGRSGRQVEVLKAARDKVLRPDILPRLPQLIQSLWGTVETDIKLQDVLVLAQVASKVKTENIKTASIDQTMTVEYRTSTGADVLWPDRAKIGQLMDRIIPKDSGAVDQTQRMQQEAARIIVLNGSNRAQVAEQTAKYLQAQGFQVLAYGNADRLDYAKTVLIDYTGAKNATVTALVKIFKIDPGNVRLTPTAKSDSDIRLIVGADWTLPNQ